MAQDPHISTHIHICMCLFPSQIFNLMLVILKKGLGEGVMGMYPEEGKHCLAQ